MKIILVLVIIVVGFCLLFTVINPSDYDSTDFGELSSINQKKRVKNSRYAGEVVAGIFNQTESVTGDTEQTNEDGTLTYDPSTNISEVTGTGAAVVAEARKWIGITPYVWGGTSLTDGADCSGFTLTIYSSFGVSLPHKAQIQSTLGTEVSKEDLQEGDLVFFGSSRDNIHHVGIYSGNGNYIHAPETGRMVEENAMTRSDFQLGRRYL